MGDYAVDGQKMAKKLSVGITKETKRRKTLLEEHNLAGRELQSTDPLSDILVPNSDFWNNHAILSRLKAQIKYHGRRRKRSFRHF